MEVMEVLTSWGESFHGIYVYQIIIFYTFNILQFICQLYLFFKFYFIFKLYKLY